MISTGRLRSCLKIPIQRDMMLFRKRPSSCINYRTFSCQINSGVVGCTHFIINDRTIRKFYSTTEVRESDLWLETRSCVIDFILNTSKSIRRDNRLLASSFEYFLNNIINETEPCTSKDLLQVEVVGNANVLKVDLQLKLLDLAFEDTMLIKNGILKLSEEQIVDVCQRRGIDSSGLSFYVQRHLLSEWFKLSCHSETPPSLLLIAPFLISKTISGLPVKAVNPASDIIRYSKDKSTPLVQIVVYKMNCLAKNYRKKKKSQTLSLWREARELVIEADRFIEKTEGMQLNHAMNLSSIRYYSNLLKAQIKTKVVLQDDLRSLRSAIEVQKQGYWEFPDKLRIVMKELAAEKQDAGKAFEMYRIICLWEIITKIIADYGLTNAYLSRNSSWCKIPLLLRSFVDFVHAERVDLAQIAVPEETQPLA